MNLEGLHFCTQTKEKQIIEFWPWQPQQTSEFLQFPLLFVPACMLAIYLFCFKIRLLFSSLFVDFHTQSTDHVCKKFGLKLIYVSNGDTLITCVVSSFSISP